jgi:hypothetical protein
MYYWRVFFTFLVFTLLGFSAFAVSEKSITLGNSAGWAAVQSRQNITDMFGLRPFGVLALESSANEPRLSAAYDLRLTFDGADRRFFADAAENYDVEVSGGVEGAERRFAKRGAGAALFTGSEGADLTSGRNREPIVILPKSNAALFAENAKIGDFSLEFYIYPDNLENGQSIFSWNSTRNDFSGKEIGESILCTTAKNRLRWSFNSFFASPETREAKNTINVMLSGISTLSPKTWSHHLIRFSKKEGLLEYIVNGELEASAYTTVSGSQSKGASVFEPLTGTLSRMVLGGSFTGILDEFSIYKDFIESSSLEKYAKQGGRIETAVLNLGTPGTSLKKLSVSAGRTNFTGRNFQNDYDFDGKLGILGANSTDAPETIAFYIRSGDNRYNRESLPWIPISTNTTLSGISGQFLEIAADFYPGTGGELTPYLEKIEIIYTENAPPSPPVNFAAVITDSGVNLKWKAPTGIDARNAVRGYLLYYGTESGVYLGGEETSLVPLDVGNTLSYHLDGLQNGVLYYFAVAAYGKNGPAYPGDFSKEIAARPLRAARNY